MSYFRLNIGPCKLLKTMPFMIGNNDTRCFAVDEVRTREAEKETHQKPQPVGKLDTTAARGSSSSHCALRIDSLLSRGRRFVVA